MTESLFEFARALPEAVLQEARERLERVETRISDAARRAGRDPLDVRLVGVAKKQPPERILASIAAGLRVLGQSYVQEARRVRPEIEARIWTSTDPASGASGSTPAPQLEWRMVGQLQRNKAKLAARLFDAVESVDRAELAEALSRRAVGEGRELEVLIQVSLCDEPQKGGCLESELPGLAEAILGLDNLRLAGLMTVPAANVDPERGRPTFAQLRGLREVLGRIDSGLAECELSMGMSADLEVAVEEGATLVRVGTALFGERVVPRSD